MSLEAELAAENDKILNRLVPRPTARRGRSHIVAERSLSPLASHSRSRGRDSRGRSSSRRRNTSRARSQGEDVNYKWSILNHDPSERFKGKEILPITGGDEEDEDEYDEISEEEQISDDDADFEFDINEVRLPNYRISINEYYKKRSGSSTFARSGNLINGLVGKSTESAIDDDAEEDDDDDDDIDDDNDVESETKTINGLSKNEIDVILKEKADQLSDFTEILALEKAIEDARSSGSEVPNNIIEEMKTKLKEVGVKDIHRLDIDDIVNLENKKNKVYDEYKTLLIEKSKSEAGVSHPGPARTKSTAHKRLVQSKQDINTNNLRVSRTVTLGKFFSKSHPIKAKDVNSYLIYLDLSSDSLNALQYTIGAVLKSGDVLYVINSADDENNIDYFKKQCDKLTNLVKTYLKLIHDEDFKAHVVIETTYHQYPRHFLDELIKYLKPSIFITGHKHLMNELSNYMTSVPLLVVKKKARRKSFSTSYR